MRWKILAVILIIVVILVGIKHAETKTTGQKGYASEWNADHVITDDVDFQKHQMLQAVAENRVDWPAGPVVGQIVYRTDLLAFYGWNGTEWTLLGRRVNYWSCSGVAFMPEDYNKQWSLTDGVIDHIGPPGYTSFSASVNLPHGSVVKAAKVWGTGDAWSQWALIRMDRTGFGNAMAVGALGAEFSNGVTPTIDNENYSYYFIVSKIPVGGSIVAARVTYIF